MTIMRAFVRLRDVLAAHRELADKIETLERKGQEHDANFKAVFEAIEELREPPAVSPPRRIGFRMDE